ncbi:uncharacterized protein J5F26_003061 [Ciconia maguari]
MRVSTGSAGSGIYHSPSPGGRGLGRRWELGEKQVWKASIDSRRERTSLRGGLGGLRPAELPGAATLFYFYPHVRLTVVQPGKTGGVGVPALAAHARRAVDAEVGRWRGGPWGPLPRCPGPPGSGPVRAAGAQAHAQAPALGQELPRRGGAGRCQPGVSGGGRPVRTRRVAASGGPRCGRGWTGPRSPWAPFASVPGLSAAGREGDLAAGEGLEGDAPSSLSCGFRDLQDVSSLFHLLLKDWTAQETQGDVSENEKTEFCLHPPWNISTNPQQDYCPFAPAQLRAEVALRYTALWPECGGQRDAVMEGKRGLQPLEAKCRILVTKGCTNLCAQGTGPCG